MTDGRVTRDTLTGAVHADDADTAANVTRDTLTGAVSVAPDALLTKSSIVGAVAADPIALLTKSSIVYAVNIETPPPAGTAARWFFVPIT